MVEENQDKSMIERLRSGEKIVCQECRKGIYITAAKDISKSYGFYCEKCNAMINAEPIINIE